ncbi:hypothetical protein EDWATA_01427 [Edwardsiella tarda ATCC 23685]|uniref:Uncharacterized protein n=1 Tax=Edwardsiella tarda ATCC 23685 TaxID=500638 RepID=D4F3W2_EDWTA|nr:hypothetical protein EDWATA_01427 [Edwardsiella tarda ATCC 23685]
MWLSRRDGKQNAQGAFFVTYFYIIRVVAAPRQKTFVIRRPSSMLRKSLFA